MPATGGLVVTHVYKDFFPPVPGGIEKHISLLCQALQPEVRTQVLVANTEPTTVIEQVDGVRVIKVAQLGRVLSAPICPTFPIWLRRTETDLFHFHVPNPTADLSFLASGKRTPVVVTYHADLGRQAFLLPAYRPFLDRFLRLAARIIVTSPRYLATSPVLRAFADKCAVVPFGIDLGRFALTAERRRRMEELRTRLGDRLILFVGRFRYYKGLHFLVQAMQEVEGTLVLVGDGPLERELRALARRLGVEGRIIFAGSVDDEWLTAYYHACDVFCLPSINRAEAFGICQLEAMACAKPVVSTDLDTGVPFVNEHGRTGLLVAPGDASGLAAALRTFLGDEALRRRLGAAGREKVEVQFTKEIMVRRVMEVYEQAIAPRRAAVEVDGLRPRAPAPAAVAGPKNALTVDFEDWFCGIEIPMAEWDGFERRAERGAYKLLEMLDRHGVRATFFILGRTAEQHPALVRAIADAGHELGVHGYAHEFVYKQTPEAFLQDVRRAIAVVESITGRRVIGHRAPYFSITRGSLWALDILADLGLRYDSSIFPVANARYGIPDFPREIQDMKTRGHRQIWEVPISTARLLGRNIPFSGGAYFRIMPYPVVRHGFHRVHAEGQPVIFYIHPWELDPDHPVISLPRRIAIPHYFNLGRTETRLDRLLDEFRFVPVAELLDGL